MSSVSPLGTLSVAAGDGKIDARRLDSLLASIVDRVNALIAALQVSRTGWLVDGSVPPRCISTELRQVINDTIAQIAEIRAAIGVNTTPTSALPMSRPSDPYTRLAANSGPQPADFGFASGVVPLDAHITLPGEPERFYALLLRFRAVCRTNPFSDTTGGVAYTRPGGARPLPATIACVDRQFAFSDPADGAPAIVTQAATNATAYMSLTTNGVTRTVLVGCSLTPYPNPDPNEAIVSKPVDVLVEIIARGGEVLDLALTAGSSQQVPFSATTPGPDDDPRFPYFPRLWNGGAMQVDLIGWRPSPVYDPAVDALNPFNAPLLDEYGQPYAAVEPAANGCTTGVPTPHAGAFLGLWPLADGFTAAESDPGLGFPLSAQGVGVGTFADVGGKRCLSNRQSAIGPQGDWALYATVAGSELRARNVTVCAMVHLGAPVASGSEYVLYYPNNASYNSVFGWRSLINIWTVVTSSSNKYENVFQTAPCPQYVFDPPQPGWHHLAQSLERSADGSSVTMRMYLDGALFCTRTTPADPCSEPVNSLDTAAPILASGYYLLGSGVDHGIRNLRAYLRALSAAEIAALAAADAV